MTTELYYLLFTAILTGFLWLPVVHRQGNGSRGAEPKDLPESRRPSPLPAWVDRANRAHMNALENFAPFAAVVLIAHAAGVSKFDHRDFSGSLLLRARRARGGFTLPV